MLEIRTLLEESLALPGAYFFERHLFSVRVLFFKGFGSTEDKI